MPIWSLPQMRQKMPDLRQLRSLRGPQECSYRLDLRGLVGLCIFPTLWYAACHKEPAGSHVCLGHGWA